MQLKRYSEGFFYALTAFNMAWISIWLSMPLHKSCTSGLKATFGASTFYSCHTAWFLMLTVQCTSIQHSIFNYTSDSSSSKSADEKCNSTWTFKKNDQSTVCKWYGMEPNFVRCEMSLFPEAGFIMVKCKAWIGAGAEWLGIGNIICFRLDFSLCVAW